MTVVKQVAVTRPRHMASLRRYLDFEGRDGQGREKACGHGSQNIADERRWFEEMDATREAHGHNSPSRAGAANTYMYHQILGFNPDDCSMNGGRMDEAACLEYARRYVEGRYPNQEAVWVLHRERCAADSTERFAVHIALNRTDLSTGRRLDEGPARKARAARVAAVRRMDREWGLRQVEAGRRNSRTHCRQPSRGERAAREAAGRTANDELRAKVARAAEAAGRAAPAGANPLREVAARRSREGVRMTVSARGDVQYRYRDPSVPGGVRKVNGATLGRAVSRATGRAATFTAKGVVRLFEEAARAYARELEDEAER